MSLLGLLKERFRAALAGLTDHPGEMVEMVRPSGDPKFGDFQANFAMPLGKKLSRPPREVAAEVVSRLDVDDVCEPPEIAGPGFINLRLKTVWLQKRLAEIGRDERLGVPQAKNPRTYVIDYSAPNVAKPMHVGHIRSTVIGAAIEQILRFLGHRVVSDNHIGDWGTQFGMIIFGYKHFVDAQAYRQSAVHELGRLYKIVNRLVEYHEARQELPRLEARSAAVSERLADARRATEAPAEKSAAKEAQKALRKLENDQAELAASIEALQVKIAALDADPQLSEYARQYPQIREEVLAETARLHAGDAENQRLWREFLPPCRTEIERMYERLGVKFDFTLGESFYHDKLEAVVEDLLARGIARVSEGAVCVFCEASPDPMVIRKRDGAFLYATTDLATIQYRVERWAPDAILYVVDHRQSLHFAQLFATARRWGHEKLELAHVSFGTVLGEDGRPFKTRSGETVALDALLDEAVHRAGEVVSASDRTTSDGPQITDERRREIAEIVGIGALKYADLSQNRTSDYVFSYDKMLAMTGNTATYMQYAYARVRSIFSKGGIDREGLEAARVIIQEPAERSLAVALIQFSDALEQAAVDYRPNVLTGYLFELANRYSTFFENCPVLRADTPEQRASRLVLCDLTARTIERGLALLGIGVVEQM